MGKGRANLGEGYKIAHPGRITECTPRQRPQSRRRSAKIDLGNEHGWGVTRSERRALVPSTPCWRHYTGVPGLRRGELSFFG